MATSSHDVRIHVDQTRYESPNPTSGEALYKLANVQPGLDLFREVKGDREDPVVEKDDEPVLLREDEHFHSGPAKAREYTIIVNGQKKVVIKKIATFEEIVRLAFPTPPTGANILYTVSYEDGPRINPHGSLKEGQDVSVKNWMISMSQRPISRSADLQRLRNEGFDIEIRSGCLLVKDVPYVNSKTRVERGILVIKLVLADDQTGKPDTHVAYFSGEHPCNEDGAEIEKIKHTSNAHSLADGVQVDCSFSAKPKPANSYPDYYSQVTTYVAIITGPAQRIDPSSTAKTFPVVKSDDDSNEPFHYTDSAASRAGIVEVTKKLVGMKLAIVGLGGTGSYVLDLLAKTPVAEIHLYDGDIFYQHNAFRSPSAPSGEQLGTKSPKTTYLKSVYGNMHRGIVDHPVYMDAGNVEELRGMDCVFLCLDKNEPKKIVVEKLEEWGIPFIDTGLGILLDDNSLGGIVRITTSAPMKRGHFRDRVSFEDAPGIDDYNQNIQIADLNALNAALAVIKWKKMCGFYRDLKCEHHTQFTIDTSLLLNEDRYE